MLARFLLPAAFERNDDAHGDYLHVLLLLVKAQPAARPICAEWRQHAANAKFSSIMAGGPVLDRMRSTSQWQELLRSNDLVYLSFVRHVLDEEGIDHLLLDEHMSALEGSIGMPAAPHHGCR